MKQREGKDSCTGQEQTAIRQVGPPAVYVIPNLYLEKQKSSTDTLNQDENVLHPWAALLDVQIPVNRDATTRGMLQISWLNVITTEFMQTAAVPVPALIHSIIQVISAQYGC